jgi:hypothetical protein
MTRLLTSIFSDIVQGHEDEHNTPSYVCKNLKLFASAIISLEEISMKLESIQNVPS